MGRASEVQPFSNLLQELHLTRNISSLNYVKSFLTERISPGQFVWFERRNKTRTGRRTDFALTLSELKKGDLNEVVGFLRKDEGENLFSNSKVVNIPANSVTHIPIVELSISNAFEDSIEVIEKSFEDRGIAELTGGGAIFKTDSSFQFIGNNFLSPSEHEQFLNLCAKTNTADSTSIVEQISRGYSSLRLTGNGYKDSPRLARVIDQFNNDRGLD